MLRRVWRWLAGERGGITGSMLGGLVVTGAVLGGMVVSGVLTGGVTGGANFWVDTTTANNTCVRQSTPGAYVDAQACSNLNAAYQAASSGDTVRVKSGTYGDQTFAARGTALTSAVVYTIEDGTHFGSFTLGESNCCGGTLVQNVNFVTLQGGRGQWTANGFDLFKQTDVTIDGVVVNKGGAQGAALYFWGNTDRTTVKNADLCCNVDKALIESWVADGAGSAPNANISLIDTQIHDAYSTNPAVVHTECFLAPTTTGMVLIRTHWYNCASTGNMNIGCYTTNNCTDQNDFFWSQNIFEAPTGSNTDKGGGSGRFEQGCNQGAAGTAAAQDYSGWVLEYNVWEAPPYFLTCGSAANGLVLRGNVGTIDACYTGATFQKNVWTDRSCSGDNPQQSGVFSTANFPGFGSGTNLNWHYSASSVLIDKGYSVFPAADFDGVTRPLGAAADAGPYEKG